MTLLNFKIQGYDTILGTKIWNSKKNYCALKNSSNKFGPGQVQKNNKQPNFPHSPVKEGLKTILSASFEL